MKRTTLIPTILSAALLAVSACSADEPGRADDPVDDPVDSVDGTDDPGGTGSTPTRTDDPERLAKVALRRFDECDAFLDYVHTEGAARVGAYGFDNQRYWLGIDDVMVMDEASTNDAAQGEGGTTHARPTVVRALLRRSLRRPRRRVGTTATTPEPTSRPRTSRSTASTNPTSSRPTAPASSP